MSLHSLSYVYNKQLNIANCTQAPTACNKKFDVMITNVYNVGSPFEYSSLPKHENCDKNYGNQNYSNQIYCDPNLLAQRGGGGGVATQNKPKKSSPRIGKVG